MLRPDIEVVESALSKIPVGRVVTIASLCDQLARDHDTNITCPMRTTNFVKTLTEIHSDHKWVPFWRVIRNNHLLIRSPFTEICAEYLSKEGFQINQNSKGEFKVVEAGSRLLVL